jgi:outer membrane protein assembly factor BamB
MKKSAALLLVVFFANFCSLFREKVVPYPTGVMFPVIEQNALSYEGEIVSLIQEKDHLLYFATRDGKVYCCDGEKQEVLWRFDISASCSSSPYLSDGRIYIADDENSFYCLDPEGKLLWKIRIARKITSGVAERGDRVFLGTEDGQLYCLSAEGGEELWRFQAGDAIRSNLAIWQDFILFGCDDHYVYFVDERGSLSGKYDAGSRIGKTLTVDENSLYFGTEDRYLQCLNLERKKTKWKILSGGATFVPPVVAGKRVLYLCWNCVLYCLNKKSGTILWWGSIPSRSHYRVEVIQDKAVVSSFSPELLCFDLKTGKNLGAFNATREIKSNPAWLAPYLLINLYDPDYDAGKLVFLKKEVKATLFPSKKSPSKKNEEIIFRAEATGFHLPMFEFFLTRYIAARFYPGIFLLFRKEEKKVVQESSDSGTWEWFPEEEGLYDIEVGILDEKEQARAEFPYLIHEGIVSASLSCALLSPQHIGQNIEFTAYSKGLGDPRYEFRLGRLRWATLLSQFSILVLETDEVVQEGSERNRWTWIPEDPGMYLIRVLAKEGEEEVSAHVVFDIEEEKVTDRKNR